MIRTRFRSIQVRSGKDLNPDHRLHSSTLKFTRGTPSLTSCVEVLHPHVPYREILVEDDWVKGGFEPSRSNRGRRVLTEERVPRTIPEMVGRCGISTTSLRVDVEWKLERQFRSS